MDLSAKIYIYRNKTQNHPSNFKAEHLGFLQPYITGFFFALNCINQNLIISKITFNIEEETAPRVVFRWGYILCYLHDAYFPNKNDEQKKLPLSFINTFLTFYLTLHQWSTWKKNYCFSQFRNNFAGSLTKILVSNYFFWALNA